ncbi:karyopherin Kap113 [Schizosaccharomyces japonicus yFS275]|uniref:Karyopherin Kap113 n=1 Tax=Schizosaccharomyces japonicus (strain yFS275 / FY16936) TaxID=402676 RepID=B6JXF6_SCHJY|nr:karyopherin Kap113 [Schizosaccharomyces japonicus yFS275]EEB06057.2 karyopherin Kap113 [Schizosaccharomyces japonicus yFS275]
MLSSLNYTKDYLMAFTEVINHTGLLFKTADESLFDFVELFSKLSVLCIRSLSHVLTELTDGTTLTSESTQSMYVELFNQEYVSQLFIVLVTAFVVLRKNDFEEWKDDPEHWVTEQLSEDVGYNIRPSAEHLVQCLFTLFKNLLIPQLQVSLSAVSQLPSSFENVIEQDAILSIIGASAESIQDIFQFEPWFLSIYNGLSDVQDVNISLVFRRRVSILISQFAPFVSNEDTIRLIYSLLPKFLTDSPCNDCVVKLTALRAYKDILDDYNFKDSCFAAVRDEVTQSMINLAPSFDVAESRQLVLDSLTALLNRLGKSVTPYAETIVNLLLQLWTDWEEEGILRAGTVSVMSVFVNAIKTGAEPFHFVLSRIVECSTNLDSDDHVMLETDGLELWAACLQNTTTLSEHFSHLFPNIIRYLSLGTSTLPFVLTVFNSYMLLEPTLLSGDVATYTLTQFRLLMDDVKNETFEFLSYSLSMLLMNCPMENISEPLVASGLLSMEITKVLENKEHPVKLSSCCLFLSRLAFRSPDLIILVCDQASADGSAMTKLVENWIQLYDHISSPGNRKLCILGLTSLLPSNHTGVLQNMNPLMHLWFSGLSEVEEDANGDAQIYYKNEDMSEFGFYLDPQTAEAKRKELMISQDAVHTVSLKSFISQAFTGCAQHYGGLEAFRASCLQNVDSALLDQFSTML